MPDPGTAPLGLEVQRVRLSRCGLPAAVVSAIHNAHAPSTSKPYSAHWCVLVDWCKARDLSPHSCTLQGLSKGNP